MQRLSITPRTDWKQKVEELGLLYHSTMGSLYWNESAAYRFSTREVEVLEAATNELHEICLEAVQHVIDQERFSELGIPPIAVPAIIRTWDEEPPSLYGRFDLAFDGVNPPKMLEYNADTPTALLEAAVVQWYWLQEVAPRDDQFNSIWESLVAKWTELREGNYLAGQPVYFAHVKDMEDLMTVTLLRDTAERAGVRTEGIHITDVGFVPEERQFFDQQGNPIRCIFKLYPWEWMVNEPFGQGALDPSARTQWIEPVWKMVLSNKGILAILWELFPHHPNLLEAHIGRSHNLSHYARKPLLSREGANVTIKNTDELSRTGGDYGEEGFVYQALAMIPDCGGHRPVIGSWVIDGVARGIGVRESDGPITDNLSRFVPHLMS